MCIINPTGFSNLFLRFDARKYFQIVIVTFPHNKYSRRVGWKYIDRVDLSEMGIQIDFVWEVLKFKSLCIKFFWIILLNISDEWIEF